MTQQEINKAIKIIRKEFDLIPTYKLEYIFNSDRPDYIVGCYGYLARYGFELNPELAEVFIRELEIKLVGHEEVEYEWTENQWKNLEYIRVLGSEVVEQQKRYGTGTENVLKFIPFKHKKEQ